MDSLVAAFPSVADADLAICASHGVAYQRDMSLRIAYDHAYLAKYRSYEGTPVALRINAARLELVGRHYRGPLLDIGVGSGEFLRQCPPGSCGFDVNPWVVQMLQDQGRYAEDFGDFAAFTFWDTLEHVDDPDVYFAAMRRGAYLFASLPVFGELARVRDSKHYRPGEHFYYWTAKGFVDWMALHGFRLLEQNRDETDAGREAIASFAFVKDLVRG